MIQNLRSMLLRARGADLRAQVLRGGIGSLLVKVGNAGLGFVTAVVLARTLGADGYGVYSYAFALISLLSIPAQFGLPNLVVRETAKAHAMEQWGLMRGLWRWASGVVGAISLVIALVGGGILALCSEHFDSLKTATFGFGLLLVPLMALGNLRGAALRGLGQVVSGQLPEMVLRPLFLVLLVLSAAMFLPEGTLTAVNAMELHVAAAAAAFLIGAWMLKRMRPAPLRGAPVPAYNMGQWLKSALPLGLIGSMELLSSYTDILLLGLFVSAQDIGVYKVTTQLAVLVSFPVMAINMVIAPHVSRLYAVKDKQSLSRLVKTSVSASFAGAGIIALCLVLFGKTIIGLFFGPEFEGAYFPMLILCGGQLLLAAYGPLVTLASMTGHEYQTAGIIAIGAVVNIVLAVILIPWLGLVGAATATMLSLIVWRTLLYRGVRKWLGLNTLAVAA